MTSLNHYFSDMGKFPVLTKAETKQLTEDIRSTYLEFEREMLSSASTTRSLIEWWDRLKQANKVTSKMSEYYGSNEYSNEDLGNLVDGVLETVGEFNCSGTSATIQALKISQHIYFDIYQKLLSWNGASHNLIKVYDDLTKLKNKLINANLRLVIKFAKPYQNMGVPLEDLIQEGNIGLMRAVDKFDPSTGNAFTTYAVWWVRQGFLRAMKRHSKMIRLPSHIQDTLSRISKLREELRRDLDREPTGAELAEVIGISEDMIEALFNLTIDPISIDASLRSGSDEGGISKTLKDYIPDSQALPDEILDNELKAQKISDTLKVVLSPIERKILILRYGLQGFDTHTLEEIAVKLSKSRERIRQIEVISIRKLRENCIELQTLQD